MLSALWAVAFNTFREAVRNKVLYSVIFFAIALFGFSLLLGGVSLNQSQLVVRDVGLFGLSFFSDMIAIFVGVTVIFQELERKTIYNVLSKPISRSLYLVGKFKGMALTLLVQFVIMAAALTAVMAFNNDSFPVTYAYALWLIYVRAVLIAGLAIFFSSFSTPYVAGFMMLGVWLVGSLVQNLKAYLENDVSGAIAESAGGLVQPLGEAIVWAAPDLSLFVLTTQLTHGIFVPFAYVTQATLYGLSYTAFFVLFGALVFQRRDFL